MFFWKICSRFGFKFCWLLLLEDDDDDEEEEEVDGVEIFIMLDIESTDVVDFKKKSKNNFLNFYPKTNEKVQDLCQIFQLKFHKKY